MSSKPAKTLTQLEEEPEAGFFGATYTEIVSTMRKAFLAVFVSSALITIFLPWEIATIVGMLVGVGVFFFVLKRIGRNRADKPLYYHRHIKTHPSSLFIQAARYYQRERNSNAGKKPHKRTRT